MRNVRRLALALSMSLALSACASKPSSIVTPAGATAFIANQAVIAIGEVQHVAIELNAVQVCQPLPCKPLLSDANTRIVVDATADSLKTIRATPSGWKATALAALDRIDDRLDAAGKSTLKAYVQAARTIINQ